MRCANWVEGQRRDTALLEARCRATLRSSGVHNRSEHNLSEHVGMGKTGRTMQTLAPLSQMLIDPSPLLSPCPYPIALVIPMPLSHRPCYPACPYPIALVIPMPLLSPCPNVSMSTSLLLLEQRPSCKATWSMPLLSPCPFPCSCPMLLSHAPAPVHPQLSPAPSPASGSQHWRSRTQAIPNQQQELMRGQGEGGGGAVQRAV
jgi:hypothetical protein